MPKRRPSRGFHRLEEDQLARLTFHGAAGEVTGSCYLLETRRMRLLIDCGLIQGSRKEERRNARRFPFEPAGLDGVLLTHAHIDHSGRLPKLVQDGFGGPIHTTRGSADLLGILLPDSGHIQEQDALGLTRRRLRRGEKPVEPLYTVLDARRSLEQVERHPYHEPVEVGPGVTVRFRPVGHILGASFLEVDIEEGGTTRRIVFSGDVGRSQPILLRKPQRPERADLLLLESTYGDRDHRPLGETLAELAQILDETSGGKGNVIIPVFAVGRAQEILLYLARLEREGRLAPRPVYLDSPMAISVGDLYGRHLSSLAGDLREELAQGLEMTPRIYQTCRTPEESMALNERRGIVILAASGMCNAGRVVHHLKHNLWHPKAHVVLVGFQAEGTVGRALVDGARRVRILGESIAVRARIHTVGGFSAHAGKQELIDWAGPVLDSGARLALVHGERDRRAALRAALRGRVGGPIWLPERGAALRIPRTGGAPLLEGREQGPG